LPYALFSKFFIKFYFRVKSPIIISQNVGDIADSNFTVTVVKINEQPFINPYVRLGRVIKLRASMTGQFICTSRACHQT